MAARGFTLPEFLAAMAIVGLLVSAGIPSWREFSRDAEVSAVTANYLHAFNSGRYAALTAHRGVTICHLEDRVCSGTWDERITVFYDDERDGRLASDADVIDRLSAALPHGVRIDLNAFGRSNYISLRGNGYYRQNGTFRICPGRGGRGRAIVINVTGRARVEQTVCD